MNEKRIVRVSRAERSPSGRIDWKRVHALRANDIEEAIASDSDAATVLDERWFRDAKLVMPERKVPVSMRVDREVLEWFRRQGRGYLSRMHAVLRAYVNAHAATNPPRKPAAPLNPRTRKSGQRNSKSRMRLRSKDARRPA
jgi:uncharacterized protein (DUF4415 family)